MVPIKTDRIPPPKLLPWLARKAGIAPGIAIELWADAQDYALIAATPGSSRFHAIAMDKLRELIAAESARQHDPLFRLGTLFPLHRRVLNALLEGFERIASVIIRRWLPRLR